MDSDEEARRQHEHEVQMFQAFRVTGTAMMDQHEAHVKNLLRMLKAHRTYCEIYEEHGSEMCVGLDLIETIETMSPYGLKRATRDGACHDGP